VKPGSRATVSRWPVARSTSATPPVPDSSTNSRPSCQRGECGIGSPRLTNSPAVRSMMPPPCGLSARQPSRTSVVLRAVTYRGVRSTMASPFKWQRSSAARAEMNGGRQRGTKL
jgi:hypothetical protein